MTYNVACTFALAAKSCASPDLQTKAADYSQQALQCLAKTLEMIPADERTSMHDVLPPYFAVVGPGFAIEPRVPQKRTFKRFLTTA